MGNVTGRHSADQAGSIHMPGCFSNTKKMVIIASMVTMIFSIFSIGFLVNELLGMVETMDKYTSYTDKFSNTKSSYHDNGDSPFSSQETDEDIDAIIHKLTVSRVMYTALICDLVMLLVSSLALLKGVFQKKPSLIMVWVAVVLVTILYAGGVLIRDIHIDMVAQTSSNKPRLFSKNLSGGVAAKLAVYSLFVVILSWFLRFVIKEYQRLREDSQLHGRTNVACFDPRFPGQSIFTVSENMTPQSHENLFKLPSYEEVTSSQEETAGKSSEGSDSARGQPPPYQPPEYSP